MAIYDAREIPTAKRIVVKVGSSSISGANADQLETLVSALASARIKYISPVLNTLASANNSPGVP